MHRRRSTRCRISHSRANESPTVARGIARKMMPICPHRHPQWYHSGCTQEQHSSTVRRVHASSGELSGSARGQKAGGHCVRLWRESPGCAYQDDEHHEALA